MPAILSNVMSSPLHSLKKKLGRSNVAVSRPSFSMTTHARLNEYKSGVDEEHPLF